jgi:GntR family transcriptional regulator
MPASLWENVDDENPKKSRLASVLLTSTSNQINAVPPNSLGDAYAELTLDKTDAKPVWRQLFAQISSLIDSGALAPGANLPAERELAQALRVSRATVKRCYDELRSMSQLGGKGRAGSVVRAVAQVQPTLGRLKGFTQEMQELGKVPSTEIIERAVIRDRIMASVFGRSSTAEFLRLVRVRKADGVPMTREVAWYDLTLVPALAQWDAQGSAYNFIETQGVTLQHAEQTVEAVQSTDQETKVFGFVAPGPCLLFKRKTYASNEQLMEYVEGTFRGDAYLYRLKLVTN